MMIQDAWGQQNLTPIRALISDGIFERFSLQILEQRDLGYRDQMEQIEIRSIMLHEATHAYLDRYVARPGAAIPRWLGEGLADYVGNSEIRDKHLVPGRTRKTEIYRGPWGAVRAKSTARFGVEDLKKAIRDGSALTVSDLLQAGPDRFYGDKHSMFYAMSWVFVHFLRHGRPEWTEETFPSLLFYVAEGYPAADVLRALYGTPEALQPEFERYAKKF